MRLEEIIRQEAFESASSKAGINLLLTASWFGTSIGQVLKPFGMSWQQYNIMRILRGQKGVPASLKLVAERMIDKMSNTSRLVDKLVSKGMVERTYCPEDRRKLEIKLSDQGADVLEQASHALDAYIATTLGTITDEKLSAFNAMLDEVRTSFTHLSKSDRI